MSLILSICLFFNSCAQQKFEKPPKSDKNKIVDKLPERLYYYINLAELKKNSDSLYCWKIDEKCHIINGKTMLHTYYQTSGDDNPKLIPYTLAEGEFLEGKYQGIWKYYDKNGKVIKKEKWDNGELIYRKGYKQKLNKSTLNIMDYSSKVNIFTQWQWKIMKSDIKNYYGKLSSNL